ncbi:MAG: hypothetical protein ACYTGN_05790 [Planctomycetota bacterium]
MNYFAHGRDDIDSPERLAGTALPDWLGASDRGVRLRSERLDDSDLAGGIRRHLADDHWFHESEAFQRTAAEIGELVRAVPGYRHEWRGWFLAHVLVEMLLDRFLIREDPARLDAYYAALDTVDTAELVERVRPWLSGDPVQLPLYINAFKEHRFLYGYADDAGLFARLRGLARRVGLPALPDPIATVLAPAADCVETRLDDLLRAPAR